MSENTNLADQLEERLPELLWRLNQLNRPIHPRLFPRGMFSQIEKLSPKTCIEDLRHELNHLRALNDDGARFFADRIRRKIDFLVNFCIKTPEENFGRVPNFGLQAISTRQQWLQKLELEINQLTDQQHALKIRLERISFEKSTQAILSIQSELGKLEQRLTKAKEQYESAIMSI